MHTTVPHHKESSSGAKVEKHCASDKGAETVKKDRILTVLCCAGLESLRVPRSREKRSIFKYSKYVSINGQTEKALNSFAGEEHLQQKALCQPRLCPSTLIYVQSLENSCLFKSWLPSKWEQETGTRAWNQLGGKKKICGLISKIILGILVSLELFIFHTVLRKAGDLSNT